MSDTIIAIDSNVIVNQAVTIEAAGDLDILSNRVISFAAAFADTSSATCYARLKWEDEADTAESWSQQADTAESWSVITGPSSTWTNQPDTAESWIPASDNTEIWQIAA